MSFSSRMRAFVILFCVGTQTTILNAQREVRNGTIMGTVLDRSGKPVRSDIMVYLWSIVDGRANPGAMCSTQTDAEGHYECHHLIFGNFVVSAHSLAPVVTVLPSPASSKASTEPSTAPAPVPAAPQKSEPQEAYPLTFYPGVSDLDSAAKIKLLKDTTEIADITVQAVPVHDIHGILPSRPSHPEIELKAHVGVLNLSTPYSASYDVVTGQFTFKSVPEGTYKILADWATQTGPHHGETSLVLSPTFDEELKIEDQPAATIRGTLHYASTPAPQLPSSVTITSKDMTKRPYTVIVGPDGSFSIPSVIDGEYEISVPHENGAYVQSIEIAGREVSPRRISVVIRGLISGVEVDLGTSSASLSGVIDAETVIPEKTGVVVQLVGSDQVVVALANQQRRFNLQDLPPGDYKLYAWSDLDDVEYRNPQYLKTFQNESTSLTIGTDAPVTDVEVTAIDADR